MGLRIKAIYVFVYFVDVNNMDICKPCGNAELGTLLFVNKPFSFASEEIGRSPAGIQVFQFLILVSLGHTVVSQANNLALVSLFLC